jgi:hypothetical protein
VIEIFIKLEISGISKNILSPEKGIHAWTYNINDNKFSKITSKYLKKLG